MKYNYKQQYLRYQGYFTRLKKIYENRPDIRAYIGILLTLLTVSFFAIFAIKPTLSTIASLSSQIKTQQEILAKLQKKVNDLQTAQNTWIALQNEIPLIKQAIPPKPDPAEFLRQIEMVSLKENTKLESVEMENIPLFGSSSNIISTATQEKLPENVKSLNFSLSISGSYTQLRDFLSDLYQLRQPVLIDSFTFSSSGGRPDEISLDITGTVPYK